MMSLGSVISWAFGSLDQACQSSMAAASSGQAASTDSRKPQFSGTMLAGDLHVMMDVGLADELGMSVEDLKGSIGKVATLHSKTEQLETASSSTKMLAASTSERLTEVQKEMELKNSQLKEEAEKQLREEIEKKNLQLAEMKKELEDKTKQLKKEAEEKLKEEIEKKNSQLEDLKNEMNEKTSEMKVNISRLQEEMEKHKVNFEKEIEKRKDQLAETKDELSLCAEGLESLMSKFDEQDKDEAEELENEEEPGIALEDQLRITEQSAKAIDLLTNHLFSTVWQTCSKNTFGFFIRIMLLSGSTFNKQLIPDTYPLVIIGFFGAFFSAAMQIILAFFLWTRLPATFPLVNGVNASRYVYPGTDTEGVDGRFYYTLPFGFSHVALPSYEYPNYKFANDVCRTVPVVQLVTIGLFLFSIFNNIPGVLKNTFIILFSDRFISEDEEGVTKLHYWRESTLVRESADAFVQFLFERFSAQFKDTEKDESQIDKNTPEWLRVKAGICVKNHVENQERKVSFEEKENIDLAAFILEMYLNGCIIQDLKGQKRIKDILHQDYCKNLEALEASRDKIGVKENCSEEMEQIAQQVPNNTEEVQRAQKETDEIELAILKLKQQAYQVQQRVECQEKEVKAFANASRRRWMLPECFPDILPKRDWIDSMSSWISSLYARAPHCCFLGSKCGSSAHGNISRSFFEVCETRSFLAEALRLIDRQNNTKQVGYAKDLVVVKERLLHKSIRDNCAVWPPPMDIKVWGRPILFCDQARLNLVRIDYLKPSPFRPYAFFWLRHMKKLEDEGEKTKLKDALCCLQDEIKEFIDTKEKAMSMNLKDMEKVKAAKETASKKKAEIQEEIKKIKEELVDDFELPKQQLKQQLKSSQDELKSLNDKLAEIEKSIKTTRDSFMKLEEELASKDIALRKAISSHVSDEKLKNDRKTDKGCFAKLNSWLYKCLTCTKCSSLSKKKMEEPSIVKAMRKYLGRDFSDVLSAVSFTRDCPSGMGWFRFFAFIFGVLPELASLLFMAVAGVQYILWSGFKVDSDTQGMEEIIMATLAINFIYEIDDAVYDHVLPELYKEAHERDRFEITGFWVSSESSAILKKCQGSSSSSWCFSCCSDRKGEHEVYVERQDSLRMLSRCEPIKWETESKHQIAQENTGNCLGASSSATLGFPKSESVSSSCCAKGLQVKENDQDEEKLVTHARASGIREVIFKRDVEGKLGFEFEPSPKTDDPYTIVNILNHDLATSSQVQEKDELHAVDGILVHTLTEDQVSALIEGKQHTTVRLSVRTPLKAEEVSASVRTTKEGKDQADQDIFKSMKGMQLAETNKYKERWADRFNKTIRKLPTRRDARAMLSCGWWCPSGWDQPGVEPFVRAMHMSVTDQWNDMYLAHAYPFLYARKLRYAFANHGWERFLMAYGKMGLHILVLIFLTLIIVGGYRTLAQCDRFAPKNAQIPIFATQAWPQTCLMRAGRVTDNFTSLERAEADEFMAVSCGVSGYVPDAEEWERNRDYFTKPPAEG